MSRFSILFGFAFCIACLTWPLAMIAVSPRAHPAVKASDADPLWPVRIQDGGRDLTVFTPQFDTYDGSRASGRVVVSREDPGGADPEFGCVWFACRLEVDRDERLARFTEVSANQVQFGTLDESERGRIGSAVSGMLAGSEATMSLEQVSVLASGAERTDVQAEGLKADPPRVLLAESPSVLLYCDGEPQTEPLAGTSCARVVNSPLSLVQAADGSFWLLHEDRWYTAPHFAGPWTAPAAPPAEFGRVAELLDGSRQLHPTAAPVQVLTSTEPAELIETDGPATWRPVPDTGLEELANSRNDVFRSRDGTVYALFSGRWFSNPGLHPSGWNFVAADALPADFGKLPTDGFARVRASVAGTGEAEDAVRDSQVPQTAAVKRDATITVTYEGGAPQWTAIRGTSLSYAVNTGFDVIMRGSDDYWCCHQGVWYHAAAPDGPWVVALQVPADLRTIPPDNPLYPTRYVDVYDVTPGLVYVGYYPGYLGCYRWGPTVVWGTGWRYRCWSGHHYWPRPLTFGFSVIYDPFFCTWASSCTWRPSLVPRPGIIIGPGGGWCGPGGLRPWRHRSKADPGPRMDVVASANIYRRQPDQVVAMTIQRPVRPTRPAAVQPLEQPFSDHTGTVFRRRSGTWERLDAERPKRMPEGGAPTPPQRPAPPPLQDPPPKPKDDQPPIRHPPAEPPRRQPAPVPEAPPPAQVPAPDRFRQLDRDRELRQRALQREQERFQVRPAEPMQRPGSRSGDRPDDRERGR